jgi:hypothetical protein
MMARHIREDHKIGKHRVSKAVTGTATFYVGKSSYVAAARIVTFRNGSTKAYELESDVPNVKGWAEPLPAGNVASGNVKTPSKVRVSDGRWAGESVKGMSTREHDLLAKTNMYDVGRVLGTVGASRNGVGAVRDTGPSFPMGPRD